MVSCATGTQLFLGHLPSVLHGALVGANHSGPSPVIPWRFNASTDKMPLSHSDQKRLEFAKSCQYCCWALPKRQWSLVQHNKEKFLKIFLHRPAVCSMTPYVPCDLLKPQFGSISKTSGLQQDNSWVQPCFLETSPTLHHAYSKYIIQRDLITITLASKQSKRKNEKWGLI